MKRKKISRQLHIRRLKQFDSAELTMMIIENIKILIAMKVITTHKIQETSCCS